MPCVSCQQLPHRHEKPCTAPWDQRSASAQSPAPSGPSSHHYNALGRSRDAVQRALSSVHIRLSCTLPRFARVPPQSHSTFFPIQHPALDARERRALAAGGKREMRSYRRGCAERKDPPGCSVMRACCAIGAPFAHLASSSPRCESSRRSVHDSALGAGCRFPSGASRCGRQSMAARERSGYRGWRSALSQFGPA